MTKVAAMAGSARRETYANPEQLRCDIDSGRTGDKVGFRDPAAVPLGTDEEAAGTPVSPWAAATARRIETARPHARTQDAAWARRAGYAWIMAGFILLLGALMVGSAFLR